MQDSEILRQIQQLVDEEHVLMERRSSGGLEGDAHARLQSVEVDLDRCWDLLRQRRALREFGRDPDAAAVRDAKTVERYEQ